MLKFFDLSVNADLAHLSATPEGLELIQRCKDILAKASASPAGGASGIFGTPAERTARARAMIATVEQLAAEAKTARDEYVISLWPTVLTAAKPADADKRKIILTRIKENRAALFKRPVLRQKPRGHSIPGGLYLILSTLLSQIIKKPKRTSEEDELADKLGRYILWTDRAMPSLVSKEKLQDPKSYEARAWEVFQHIRSWEGLATDINAYDLAAITWGAGFAAPVTFRKLVANITKRSPAAQKALLCAGFALESGKDGIITPLAVELDKGVVRGDRAERLLRGSEPMICLLFNIALGDVAGVSTLTPEEESGVKDPADRKSMMDARIESMRQAVLDANYETWLGLPSGLRPDNDPGWSDLHLLALAAHAIHFAPGWFNWGTWRTVDMENVLSHITKVLHDHKSPDFVTKNSYKDREGRFWPYEVAVKKFLLSLEDK